MSSMDLVLSEKYKAFLKCQTPVEFLEGTTAAGKTTVGIFKFMLKVAQSPKKLHILAADDTGTACICQGPAAAADTQLHLDGSGCAGRNSETGR